MTSYTPPGHHKTFAAFRDHLRAVGPSFDADEDVLGGPDGALAQPFEASGLAIGNRFAMHPMEGWDGTREGLPTAHTLRGWRRFGQSGAKLIWGGEAFAVQSDGRANPNQLYLNDDVDVLGGLRALLAEVHEGHAEAGFDRDGLVVGLQLTHSGRWSRPDGPPVPRTVQRHPIREQRPAPHPRSSRPAHRRPERPPPHPATSPAAAATRPPAPAPPRPPLAT